MKKLLSIFTLLVGSLHGFGQCEEFKIDNYHSENNLDFITESSSNEDFYALSAEQNRILWFADIESPDKTKFTKLWDDYHDNNFRVDQWSFIERYKGTMEVELAFQFGPNMDLWAYHSFVIKKIEDCYLVTRSYYRHARFTYKAYSVINSMQLEELYNILNRTNNLELNTIDTADYRNRIKYTGFFVDNRNLRQFYIDFENEYVRIPDPDNPRKREPSPGVKQLYNFVDEKIEWIVTFEL